MAKKLKLPKRIAGVKIPKSIRKGPVGQFLSSSGGQVLLAEALLLAGGALAGRRMNGESGVGEALRHPVDSLKKAGRAAATRGNNAREAVDHTSAKFSRAFSEAVRAFRAVMEEPDSAGVAAMPEAGPVLQTEPTADGGKKKSGGSRPETSSTPH
jgi:hypothetical protein